MMREEQLFPGQTGAPQSGQLRKKKKSWVGLITGQRKERWAWGGKRTSSTVPWPMKIGVVLLAVHSCGRERWERGVRFVRLHRGVVARFDSTFLNDPLAEGEIGTEAVDTGQLLWVEEPIVQCQGATLREACDGEHNDIRNQSHSPGK